jgi:hypothetical protein
MVVLGFVGGEIVLEEGGRGWEIEVNLGKD